MKKATKEILDNLGDDILRIPAFVDLCGRFDDDTCWKWREMYACKYRYTMPLFTQEQFFSTHTNPARDHFVHVCQSNPDLLSYTQSDEKGMSNRQTPVKVGRYLAKFFSDVLSAEEIKTHAQAHKVKFGKRELLFATEEDDIYNVYMNGPESCMSHADDCYSSEVHPVRMYAHSNLAIAHILNSCGRVAARVAVNMDTKKYTAVYGDSVLVNILEESGFSRGGLRGGRLQKYEQDGNFIVPYLDGHDMCIGVHDDYLEIVGDGDMCCDSTDGLVHNSNRVTCDMCSDYMQDIDAVYVTRCDIYICPVCRDNSFAMATDEDGEVMLSSDESIFETSDGEFFTTKEAALANGYITDIDCDVVLEEDCVIEVVNDEWVLETEATEIIVASSGDEEWVANNYIVDHSELFVTERGSQVLNTIVFIDDTSDDVNVLEELSVWNMSEIVTLFELSCDVVEKALSKIRICGMLAHNESFVPTRLMFEEEITFDWDTANAQQVATIALNLFRYIKQNGLLSRYEYSDVEWFDIVYDGLNQLRGAA